MDEAQNSYLDFAMLQRLKMHFAFKLQDVVWKTRWNRPWTLHINRGPGGSSKVCLTKNCRIGPKHRIIPIDQNLQDQIKTVAVEIKLLDLFF